MTNDLEAQKDVEQVTRKYEDIPLNSQQFRSKRQYNKARLTTHVVLTTKHQAPRHIGPRGLAYLTIMVKTALKNNIIPHIWTLANIVVYSSVRLELPISMHTGIIKTNTQCLYIVPIPKPNKDIDYGTSYRPISVLWRTASSLHNNKHTKHPPETRVQNSMSFWSFFVNKLEERS